MFVWKRLLCSCLLHANECSILNSGVQLLAKTFISFLNNPVINATLRECREDICTTTTAILVCYAAVLSVIYSQSYNVPIYNFPFSLWQLHSYGKPWTCRSVWCVCLLPPLNQKFRINVKCTLVGCLTVPRAAARLVLARKRLGVKSWYNYSLTNVDYFLYRTVVIWWRNTVGGSSNWNLL